MILAYVALFVHLPAWATIGAAIGTVAGTMWAFWEQLMSRAKATMEFLKSWREYREQGRNLKADRQKRKAQEWEDAVRAMLNKIEMEEFQVQQKPGQSNYRLKPIQAGPEDDPAIVAEAWRRFQTKREERDNESWKKRKN